MWKHSKVWNVPYWYCTVPTVYIQYDVYCLLLKCKYKNRFRVLYVKSSKKTLVSNHAPCGHLLIIINLTNPRGCKSTNAVKRTSRKYIYTVISFLKLASIIAIVTRMSKPHTNLQQFNTIWKTKKEKFLFCPVFDCPFCLTAQSCTAETGITKWRDGNAHRTMDRTIGCCKTHRGSSETRSRVN